MSIFFFLTAVALMLIVPIAIALTAGDGAHRL